MTLLRKKSKVKKEKKPVNPKLKQLTAVLNRFSLFFHALLACAICFTIEWISRHSFVEACKFAVDRNLVFLYNSFIVWASLTLVYLVKRRLAARIFISFFWLVLGIVNGCILAKRVSPFGWTDLKMVGEMFTMRSNYFTNAEAMLIIVMTVIACALLVVVWIKGPKFAGRTNRIAGLVMVVFVVMLIPGVTEAAKSTNVLTSYFENLAQGYKDYGFIYSFSSSALDLGMSTPEDYSEETIEAILDKTGGGTGTAAPESAADDADVGPQASLVRQTAEKTQASLETETQTEEIPEETDEWENPNIIVVLLESFVNPDLINFLTTSSEAVPNFEYLYDHYSSGYLEVPVVGAGTANTEFEVLTGMSMQYFGLGEIPYKTILKDTDCESVASDLKTVGYGAHVVHNNGGNFYSRANAFSQMGFDTFTCKEVMDIHDYTPLGTWPTDHILVSELEKTLDYTPDQQDFVYVISVGSHGEYPDYEIIEDPEITVSGVEDEGMAWEWEYYVNMLREVDTFIGELTDMLEERGEPTYMVLFGDHLPTMGLTDEDMTTGSLFLTQYVTWNNLGMEKEDRNMTSYQLVADTLETLGLGGIGTMFTFQQNRDIYATEEEYQTDLELLQYDLLYGERYAYGGEDLYPASDLVIGTQDVVIDQLMEVNDYVYVIGDNFTKWSKVYVNDEKISTTYYSSTMLRFKKDKLQEGENTIVVNQVGSSNTIFRSSNELYLTVEAAEDPDE